LSLRCTVFEIFDFRNGVTLKTGLGMFVLKRAPKGGKYNLMQMKCGQTSLNVGVRDIENDTAIVIDVS